MSEPWLIHFFQRHRDDDPARPVPTVDFLDRLPDKIAAEIQAVLGAVAAAPPPSFSGGGKWEAMHEDMAGFYEVRVRGGAASDCVWPTAALIVMSIAMALARDTTVDNVGLAGPAPNIRRTTSGRMPACRASSAFDNPRSLRRSSSARTTPSTAAMRARAVSRAWRYSGLLAARFSK
jgi:hypothetical protein